MTTKETESSQTVTQTVSNIDNIDWLRVLAFGMETQAVQSEPHIAPGIFEVLP